MIDVEKFFDILCEDGQENFSSKFKSCWLLLESILFCYGFEFVQRDWGYGLLKVFFCGIIVFFLCISVYMCVEKRNKE